MANNISVKDSSDTAVVVKTTDNASVHTPHHNVDGGTIDTVTTVTNITNVVSVDDNAGSLTVDNAGTFAVQVDAALPAGTNAIGKLAANSGVDIGDVDVLSLPGVAAEAAALGSGVLIQGDDGTDRKNINVDATTGDVQVDVTNTVTVSGTVTANAGTGTFTVDGSGVTQPVSAASLPLPTGAATEATLAAIQTAVELSDNVVVVEDAAAAANPTGTQAMMVRQDTPTGIASLDGDHVAQRATDYGAAYVQVVTSSGSFVDSFGGSGGTSHADDAAFSIGGASSITPMGALADDTTPDSVDEGDVGVPRMTLDRKLLTRIVGATDGNRADVDSSGHLQMDIAASSAVVSIDDNSGSLTVDNAGTFAVQVDGSALTALQLIDDVVYTDDTSTHATGSSKGALLMAAAAPTDGAVDANDVGAVAMSTDRRLHTDTQIVGQDADITIADGGNAITVDWNGTAPPIGSGVEATALRVTVASDSSGVLSVDDNGGAISVDDNSGSLTVDNAGTFAVQVDGSALTALQLIDNTIVAHDAAITGATGLNAIGLNARSTAPTAVGDGDAVRAMATLLGKQVNLPYAIPAQTWQYAGTTAITDTADDAVKAAGAAGVRNYVTSITVTNSHASVGTQVTLKDGSTAIHTGYAAEGGGGFTATFPTPLRGSAATAVNVACATTGSNTFVSVSGFSAAE